MTPEPVAGPDEALRPAEGPRAGEAVARREDPEPGVPRAAGWTAPAPSANGPGQGASPPETPEPNDVGKKEKLAAAAPPPAARPPAERWKSRTPDPNWKKGWPTAQEAIQWLKDTFAAEGTPPTRVLEYHYPDEDGAVDFGMLRLEFADPDRDKETRPLSLWADGRWRFKFPPKPELLPLYMLPELANADQVFICEGEKCTNLLRDLGLAATTSAAGARSAGRTDWSALTAKDVVIVLDNNKPGEGYGRDVNALLDGLDPKPTVRVLRLPGLAEGEDVEQWLERLPEGWDPEQVTAELLRLADAAPAVNLDEAVRGSAPETPEAGDEAEAEAGAAGGDEDAQGAAPGPGPAATEGVRKAKSAGGVRKAKSPGEDYGHLFTIGRAYRCLDRKPYNHGVLEAIQGDRGHMRFQSELDGKIYHKALPLTVLANPDTGKPILEDPDAEPFVIDLIDSATFFTTDYRLEWLVRRVLVANQPCVIGGPRKALKTSLLLDLAVSLATARQFLGEFIVPRPFRVGLFSGESGPATIQDTARRVCRAKGTDPLGGGDLIDPRVDLSNLSWAFKLPQLSSEEQLAELVRVIKEARLEVAVIDPIYLCLLGGEGGRRVDPGNLFDMGPLLARITDACLAEGCTPLLAHHFKKNRDAPYDPPDLEDLSHAGIQEFARQWVLIGRRRRYESGSGRHELYLSVGGSAGHSSDWALDVDEGVLDDAFGGRKWETTIQPLSAVRAESAKQSQDAQAERAAERARTDQEARIRTLAVNAELALAALREMEDGRATATAWRNRLNWEGEKINPAIARLLDDGSIRKCEIPTRTGQGTRPVPGYEVTANLLNLNKEPE
jgi:replicative DNA helicase